MKGQNRMMLNQSTMIEALQYWLRSQFAPGRAPTVVDVGGQVINGKCPEFKVTFDAADEEGGQA